MLDYERPNFSSLVIKERKILPITDPVKKRIAQEHRLYAKICRKCGKKNAVSAKRCRKCRSSNLRWKKRDVGSKARV